MSSGSKKEEILKASIQIFVDEGFDRPSMDSIAAHARVSKRTLYKHFSSKRALLDQIVLCLINENQNSLKFDFDPEAKLELQLNEIVTQKARFLLCPSNIKLAKIILSEYLKDAGFYKEKVETVLKSEKISLRWIEQAQAAGALSSEKSAVELLDFLNEIINGIIFFPVLFGKKEALRDQDVTAIVHMFMHVVGNQ